MRKLHVLMFAVAAVFAIAAVSATSALAFTELLSNGNPIAANTAISITGEIVLHGLTSGAEVLCAGSFDGSVATGGKTGEISEILTSGKALVAETGLTLTLASAAGDGVECAPVKVCEIPPAETPLVVALKLPWDLEVLPASSEIHLLGVEYWLMCRVLGILFENTCSGEATASILNDSVTGDAAAKFEENLPELSCDNGELATALSDEENSLLVDTVNGTLLTWS